LSKTGLNRTADDSIGKPLEVEQNNSNTPAVAPWHSSSSGNPEFHQSQGLPTGLHKAADEFMSEPLVVEPNNFKSKCPSAKDSSEKLYPIILKTHSITLTGHVYFYVPVWDARKNEISYKNVGFNPVKNTVNTAFGKVQGKVDVEKDDSHLDEKHLVTATIYITKQQYLQLAKNIERDLREPGDYNLFGEGAQNCVSFVDAHLKAIGIKDGIKNKFDERKLQKAWPALVQMQTHYLSDENVAKARLNMCAQAYGNDDLNVFSQYKEYWTQGRLVVEFEKEKSTKQDAAVTTSEKLKP